MRFDPEHVREIMWQGMTEDEYRNAPEPFDYEQAFDEAGRSCVRLLWAALTTTFGKQRCRWRRRIIKHLIYFHLNKCNPWVYKMVQRQTHDIVDTPSKDRRIWPALEAFQERKKSLNGAIFRKANTSWMKSKTAVATNASHRSC